MGEYYKSLNHEDQLRYAEKLTLLGCTISDDPFLSHAAGLRRCSTWTDSTDDWPLVEFGQIYTYLINTPGVYTQQTLSAYKSLDAYNFYACGWVQTCYHFTTPNRHHIIQAEVMRSQAVSEKPHRCWVGTKPNGDIICAHCTCKAGLGEACSHVAAVMFKLEAIVRLAIEQKAPTSLPCTWNRVSCKKVDPAPVSDIQFFKPTRKKMRVDKENEPPKPCNSPHFDDVTPWLNILRTTMPDAAVLTVVNPHVNPRPLLTNPTNPTMKSSPVPKNFNMFLGKSTKEAMEMIHNISESAICDVEVETRGQSNTKVWYQYRRGRITSSVFGEVMKTKIEKPSTSLMNKICQYSSPSSTIPSIKWGRDHEQDAIDAFEVQFINHHANASISKSGLVLDTTYPYLGASPDAVLKCSCHGKGVLEVKCPFSIRHLHPCVASSDSFYLSPHTSSQHECAPSLCRRHNYYYQIVGQMEICNAQFGCFVVWTPIGLHVETIIPDHDLFKFNMIPKLTTYFEQVLLPELVDPNQKTGQDGQHKTYMYCTCGNPESYDDMIGCDNHSCNVQWFHLKCVGLTAKSIPNGRWLCEECSAS